MARRVLSMKLTKRVAPPANEMLTAEAPLSNSAGCATLEALPLVGDIL
jgi:hypothetical protein